MPSSDVGRNRSGNRAGARDFRVGQSVVRLCILYRGFCLLPAGISLALENQLCHAG